MEKEIIEKIEAYLENIEELELPKHKVCIPEIAREIAAAIAPLINGKAQDFAGWICHQVVAGRTYQKLWLDYCAEKSIIPIVSTDSPDWNDVPPWAEYKAQQPEGDWYCFERMPMDISDGYSFGGKCLFLRNGDSNPNWKETLQKRPKTA